MRREEEVGEKKRSGEGEGEGSHLFLQELGSTVGIGVMRVASIDDDVTCLQEGKESSDLLIHWRTCTNHHHDLARGLE
jgi:hypothetical protein